MQTDLDYLELLDSAKSVLRGTEPRGTLACIEDVRTRRRFATEFMQHDASTQMPAQWQVELHAAMASVWVVRTEAASWRRAALPDGFEPVCWYSWRNPRSLSDEVVRMRRQAARSFPVAMFQAVWTAHSDESAWRVRAAWEVLDAVDNGMKLIAPLMRFLRVSRKAIKLSARHSEFEWKQWLRYGRTRRALRTFQRMHALGSKRLHAIDRYCPVDWLPEVDVVMHTTKVRFTKAWGEVKKTFFLPGRPVVRPELRRLIRRIRKEVAVEEGRIPAIPRRRFSLSSGWTAHSLVTTEELSCERREMEISVPRYWEIEVRSLVLSLTCVRSNERLTVIFTFPTLSDDARGDRGVPGRVDFKVRDKGSISVAALLALIELSQQLGVPELRIDATIILPSRESAKSIRNG